MTHYVEEFERLEDASIHNAQEAKASGTGGSKASELQPLDPYTLVEDINQDQQRLGLMEDQLKAALQLRVDAVHELEKAKAAVSSAQAAIKILNARLIAKQSILKSVPK